MISIDEFKKMIRRDQFLGMWAAENWASPSRRN